MLTIKVQFYGDETERYYFIENEDLVNLNTDDDGDWIEDNEINFAKGFKFDGKWITDHETSTDTFNIVEYKELSREYDFYGTGCDKIIALVDGEEVELQASRWQGQTGYYTSVSEELEA